MSLPRPPASTSGRRTSMASHSSPRFIPGASDSIDGTSSATSDANFGSFRGYSDIQNSAINSGTASGQREPTRSFIHHSYRGALGALQAWRRNGSNTKI
jgi:SulP family sulfate permease